VTATGWLSKWGKSQIWQRRFAGHIGVGLAIGFDEAGHVEADGWWLKFGAVSLRDRSYIHGFGVDARGAVRLEGVGAPWVPLNPGERLLDLLEIDDEDGNLRAFVQALHDHGNDLGLPERLAPVARQARLTADNRLLVGGVDGVGDMWSVHLNPRTGVMSGNIAWPSSPQGVRFRGVVALGELRMAAGQFAFDAVVPWSDSPQQFTGGLLIEP
jgi:hypothetical protein